MGSARRNDPFTLDPLPFTAKDGSGSGLVVRPVFKTAMEAPSAAPVGSIPTRSRHLTRTVIVSVALLVSLTSTQLAGQAQPRPAPPAAAPSPAPARTDSLTRRYLSPYGALWRSLLLPGWGQARLNRKLTAGLFIAWEGVTLGMSLKTLHELDYLRRTNSGRADDKRQEHEDWLVLLGFNHVLAGLEAYISAHLADFPGDLHLEAVPGGAGAGISWPVRLP